MRFERLGKLLEEPIKLRRRWQRTRFQNCLDEIISGSSIRCKVALGGQWAGPPEDCGDRKRFWSGARPRRGESESCLMTYWKTSKPGILKRSITASKSCSLGKSGSCCIALTGTE